MRVQNAVAAVGAFASEGQCAFAPVEFRAPVDQFLDGRGAFLRPGCRTAAAVAEAIAGVQRVLLVQFHLVVIAQGHGDAALRIFRRGFAQALFGDHQDAAGRREFDRRAHTGNAGADHQKVRIHVCYCDHSRANLCGLHSVVQRAYAHLPRRNAAAQLFGDCASRSDWPCRAAACPRSTAKYS